MIWYLDIKGEKIVGAYSEKLNESMIQMDLSDTFDRTRNTYKDGKIVPIDENTRRIIYNEEVYFEEESSLQAMMKANVRTSFLVELPDEKAKDIPLCFDSWSTFAEGYSFTEGQRVEYEGGLWKCKKTHKKQASWYPGADPTLWEQLDKENHAGTLEDPIPVPDSVSTSGFTYIYGKYYSEADQKYLFKRGGIPDEQAEAMYGQSETLYFPPSALVGSYTEVVS